MINVNIKPYWEHVKGKESGYNNLDLDYSYSRKLAHEVIDEALERFGYHLSDDEYTQVAKLHDHISDKNESTLKETVICFGDYILIID